METRIEKINIDENKRIIVISDIHGHYDHLTNLLSKARFSKDDILIILGDMIDKGPKSLETLRYIMDLCKTHIVYPIMGNVDAHRLQMIENDSNEGIDDLFHYLKFSTMQWGSCLFYEMCNELNLEFDLTEVELYKFDDKKKLRDAIKSGFSKELDFLRGLPTIIETQKYIFVHGGIPTDDIDSLIGTEAYNYMKIDAFMEKEYSFNKSVVVGHWPVTLYNESIASANPVINKEKKIISIDGGCGLKRDGQLNALIIPNMEADNVDFVAYDNLPKIIAKSSQNASEDSINIRYIDNLIAIIEKGEEFSLAEHISTRRRLLIHNDYIYKNGDKVVSDDYTDYLLQINAGDQLSIVTKTSKGYLVKKDGISGWYLGEIE